MGPRWGATTGLAALIGLHVALQSGVARGQDPAAEGALAEMLYRQGRALIADGKVSEACPKFAESYRLDATTGTLLNLASCHESEGKLATAWLEFSRGAAMARRDRRYDRVRFAEDRMRAIEPRLSYLAVVFPPESEPAGLEVRVDGVVVRTVARGVSTPIDPGEHTVDATAPGHRPRTQRVSVAAQDATNVTVLIPTLEPLAPASPTTIVPSEPPARVPLAVYVAGGVTLALAAGAGISAYVYMDHRARDGVEQSPPDFERNRTWGAVNVALDAGVLVGAGVTAYLYWTRPQVGPRAAAATGHPIGRAYVMSFAPWIGPGAAGFGLRGSL